MIRTRMRGVLTARRFRFCRALYRRAALPGRYDRVLLFGGGIVMTLLTLAAAAIGIAHRFERCLDDWRAEFLAQRDFVNASVQRNQARLRHMVETYEALVHVHERDAVPAERYRRLLALGRGVAVTEADLGVAPFTILSTLTGEHDRARLSMLLRLVREISPASLLRPRGSADAIGGFLYTEDKRFLAAWPPLDAGRLVGAGGPSAIEPTIARFIANVDAELRKHTDDELRHERVFWVALYDSRVYGTLVKHYAAPVYRDNVRVAVLVVTVPATQIPRLFQPEAHDPDFFMVSRDRRHLLGLDESNPRKRRWRAALLAAPSVLDLADERVRFVRDGGAFFMVQRIAGPSWIAVSAFGWRTILANLSDSIRWIAILGSIVLAAQWAFVVLVDRLVLAPLRMRARSVFESEAFGRTVLATAPVGLTVFDPMARRIVMQNGIARALLAASPDETGFYMRLVQGRAGSARTVRSSGRRRGRGAAEGAVRTVEATVTAADGRRRELSVALAHARYREREVVLCSLTDISDQKETVRLLRRARHTADEASQAKSMLVATISHEIRTPLYGALGNLELLSLEPLAPSQTARVGSVRRAFDALLSLVDDVLDLSKAEARQLQLHLEPFRLDELLERCAQTFAPTATAKGLRFSCLVDPAVAGHWRGDARRVTQVVTNLLANACKFTERGAVTLHAGLARDGRCGEGGESVVISVADSGIGIAASRQARIFEAFTQADESVGRRFGGTGLGLSLCRRLVELMGGRIDVKSAKDEGAVFTVWLGLQREAMVPYSPPHHRTLGFDELIVACESEAWQRILLAQLRIQFGAAIHLSEARFDEAAMPRAAARAVLVLGAHADAMPAAWRDVRDAFVDVIVVSERGPLRPQRRRDVLHVTALSATQLQLALGACGKATEQGESRPTIEPVRPVPAQPGHCAMRILVVEDEPVSRTLLMQQLAALGYRHVEAAGDGREALSRCLRHGYDLVMADLCMPAMDGRALLAALRDEGMTMPVVAHTAAPCEAAAAEKEGFARLIHKPVALDGLRTVLDAVLGEAQTCDRTPSRLADEPAERSLRDVFAESWPEDDARLAAAARQNDREAFLQTLHRINGALLTLNERALAAQCERLRDAATKEGMAAVVGPLASLRGRIGAITASGGAGNRTPVGRADAVAPCSGRRARVQ